PTTKTTLPPLHRPSRQLAATEGGGQRRQMAQSTGSSTVALVAAPTVQPTQTASSSVTGLSTAGLVGKGTAAKGFNGPASFGNLPECSESQDTSNAMETSSNVRSTPRRTGMRSASHEPRLAKGASAHPGPVPPPIAELPVQSAIVSTPFGQVVIT